VVATTGMGICKVLDLLERLYIRAQHLREIDELGECEKDGS